jgi:hypothetical protein
LRSEVENLIILTAKYSSVVSWSHALAFPAPRVTIRPITRISGPSDSTVRMNLRTPYQTLNPTLAVALNMGKSNRKFYF